MKKIILIGNSSYTDMLRYYLENDANRQVVAYAVEKEFLNGNVKNGLPVLDIEQLPFIFNNNQYSVIIGIGYTKMNHVRKKLYERCVQMGYYIENFIHSTAIVDKNLKIGEGNIFLERVIIGPNCKIGDANIFFMGSVIAHDDIIGNYNFFSINAAIAGFINIGDNCFFGVNAAVKNGLNVPSDVLVGASAYLSYKIEQGQVLTPPRSIILDNKNSIDFI